MSGEAYHLIPLTLAIVFFYALSLILVRFGVSSRRQNRRIWNYLLLFFFFSTAILGLLLSVKVNYKLEISWIEEAMQWHVDCGIGFASVAIFHLLWHFRYYFRGEKEKFMPAEGEKDVKTPILLNPWQERIFFFLLGYISMMAQLALLRENIKSFHGNELVIGIFLAIWMLLTAVGSQAGNNYRQRLPAPRLLDLLLLMSFLPLIIYILLILEMRFFFLPGYQAGILEMTISILVLTVIFTGVSGFLFGYVSKTASAIGSRSAPYRLDALGSLAGGVLFSLVLVHMLGNLQQLTLLFLSSVLLVLVIFRYPGLRVMKFVLTGTGILIFTLSLLPGAIKKVEGIRYPQEEVLRVRETPHGNLSFTTRNDQITGYLDGNPVVSAADLTRAEESVHFPALQHPDPKTFLLMNGGLSGQINEAAKYHPERIDYCEADPWIYRLGRSYFPETDKNKLQFIPKDGRSWLMKSRDNHYDVIISMAGDPVTIGWNRYFTKEFYELVKQHLNPHGFFCMQLSAGGNYVSDEGSALLGINYHTLKEVFTHVQMVPGTFTYFIASEHPVSLDFPALLDMHEIPTTYVHPDYMNAMQLRFDSEQLSQRIQTEKAVINRDLHPRLFFASLTGLQSSMGKHALGISGILASLLLVLLWTLYNPVKSAMYVSGFTGAGIQMVLIMVMQSFYGFAYLIAPLMITLFMGGIVLGTLARTKVWKKASISGMIGQMGLLALISLLGFLFLKAESSLLHGAVGQMGLGFLNLITGALVGAVYALASNLKMKSNANSPGILYSADLTGAALGTLLPVVFLLPLIGVMNTFILFIGINIITALRLLFNTRLSKDG